MEEWVAQQWSRAPGQQPEVDRRPWSAPGQGSDAPLSEHFDDISLLDAGPGPVWPASRRPWHASSLTTRVQDAPRKLIHNKCRVAREYRVHGLSWVSDADQAYLSASPYHLLIGSSGAPFKTRYPCGRKIFPERSDVSTAVERQAGTGSPMLVGEVGNQVLA